MHSMLRDDNRDSQDASPHEERSGHARFLSPATGSLTFFHLRPIASIVATQLLYGKKTRWSRSWLRDLNGSYICLRHTHERVGRYTNSLFHCDDVAGPFVPGITSIDFPSSNEPGTR